LRVGCKFSQQAADWSWLLGAVTCQSNSAVEENALRTRKQQDILVDVAVPCSIFFSILSPMLPGKSTGGIMLDLDD